MKDILHSYFRAAQGRQIINIYFKCWALVLPVTSFLVFPSIQGTTPAYLMAFLSVPLILFAAPIPEVRNYFWVLFLICLGYITLSAVSQFIISVGPPIDLSSLPLVDPLSLSRRFLLRPTLFSQSLYLLAAILAFLFVRQWYHKSWDSYIFAGILLLVAYGFYEVFYYWITGTSGDFISNRTFNFGYWGSSTHIIDLAGLSMLRMKSLTGEASMFAFTVLPYWVFAIHKKRIIIAGILTLALLFSTSTTAILGMLIYTGVLIISNKINWKYLAGLSAVFVTIAIIKFDTVFSVLNELVFKKFSTTSISGNVRITNFLDSVNFWIQASLPTKIFGLGFGYIRSTDFLSTLLVNNGLIGLVIFLLFFTYPILALGGSPKDFALKAALIILAVTMLISVTEYTYLPTWLFAGIAYHQLSAHVSYPPKIISRSVD